MDLTDLPFQSSLESEHSGWLSDYSQDGMGCVRYRSIIFGSKGPWFTRLVNANRHWQRKQCKESSLPSEEGTTVRVFAVLPESEAQILAMTVLHVPDSFESGPRVWGMGCKVSVLRVQGCGLVVWSFRA